MASPAGEPLALVDDVLEEILIRLPTLADLGRACAVCAAFRRVITGHAFLRCVRALHPPALLGFYTLFRGFDPTEPPHPSAPASRALAAAADFGFSFLPSLGFWMVRDARGGRFLVDCDEGMDRPTFTTIAVCDPLFRRYVLLPPIPPDLAAAVQHPHLANAFLAPCSAEGGGGDGGGAGGVVQADMDGRRPN